jgi:hypothetical protein
VIHNVAGAGARGIASRGAGMLSLESSAGRGFAFNPAVGVTHCPHLAEAERLCPPIERLVLTRPVDRATFPSQQEVRLVCPTFQSEQIWEAAKSAGGCCT